MYSDTNAHTNTIDGCMHIYILVDEYVCRYGLFAYTGCVCVYIKQVIFTTECKNWLLYCFYLN